MNSLVHPRPRDWCSCPLAQSINIYHHSVKQAGGSADLAFQSFRTWPFITKLPLFQSVFLNARTQGQHRSFLVFIGWSCVNGTHQAECQGERFPGEASTFLSLPLKKEATQNNVCVCQRWLDTYFTYLYQLRKSFSRQTINLSVKNFIHRFRIL